MPIEILDTDGPFEIAKKATDKLVEDERAKGTDGAEINAKAGELFLKVLGFEDRTDAAKAVVEQELGPTEDRRTARPGRGLGRGRS